MDDDNIILIDWLSFTVKDNDYSIPDLVELLGLCAVPWEAGKGAHGYRDRQYFNGISIHFNGRDDMGIWCEMSGQGCRAYESLGANNYPQLFKLCQFGNLHLTRLDVAYDDHTGVLDLPTICQDCINGEFISKSDYWVAELSSKGQTVYHGSPQSDIMIRIYDKARERNCPDGTHWVRVEIQLRKDRALQFVSLPYPLGESFSGVLCNYLRYVDPDPCDSNRWRWPLKNYWGDLLCGASAIKLYVTPGIEYNLDRCEHFVYKQAGNAVEALINLYGTEKFLDKLQKRATRPNPKYQQLLDTYKDFEF